MKRVALSFAVASLTSTTALAADLAVKATPAGPAARRGFMRRLYLGFGLLWNSCDRWR
jgi:hypothetical protein